MAPAMVFTFVIVTYRLPVGMPFLSRSSCKEQRSGLITAYCTILPNISDCQYASLCCTRYIVIRSPFSNIFSTPKRQHSHLNRTTSSSSSAGSGSTPKRSISFLRKSNNCSSLCKLSSSLYKVIRSDMFSIYSVGKHTGISVSNCASWHQERASPRPSPEGKGVWV